MYRDLKHKDTLQESLAIQNLRLPFYSTTPQQDKLPELNLPGNLQQVLPDLQSVYRWHCTLKSHFILVYIYILFQPSFRLREIVFPW